MQISLAIPRGDELDVIARQRPSPTKAPGRACSTTVVCSLTCRLALTRPWPRGKTVASLSKRMEPVFVDSYSLFFLFFFTPVTFFFCRRKGFQLITPDADV